MKHIAKNFEYLVGKIQGMSEKQLRAHFGLYEGYVKKINEIEEKLKSADRSAPNYSYNETSELQRRLAVPYNGAYLHQLFFENLTGTPRRPADDLKTAIESTWGSMEKWWEDAKSCLISAPGWCLLTYSDIDGTLRNDLVEEHHRGVLVEQRVLLALDGWEHAYMIDYGTSKAEYCKVLHSAIDWDVVSGRYHAAQRVHRLAA